VNMASLRMAMGCGLLVLTLGCNSSPRPGNQMPRPDAKKQQSAQNPPNANGKHPGPATQTRAPFSEPTQSVSERPSANSDEGVPAAVAHRSVAEPGAPEGTVQREKQQQDRTGESPQPQ
jgi:hypothetical protein